MSVDSDFELGQEIKKLANLLEVSAGVARRLAARRVRNRAELHDLADQLEDVSLALHEIVESDQAAAAKGGHAP